MSRGGMSTRSNRKAAFRGLYTFICLVMITGLARISFSSAADIAPSVTSISFWEFTGHAAELVQSLVDEFNQTIGRSKGIHIELTNHGRNFQHMFEMAMDRGTLPDIFPNREPFVRKLISQNRLLPINSLPGGNRLLKKYDIGQLDVGIHYNGSDVFAVPRTVTTYRLIYNRELFVRAGIVDRNGNPTPPKTWDELRSYAKRISNIESGKTFGIIFPMKGSSVGEYGFFWEYKVVRPFSSSFGKIYFDNAKGRYDFMIYKPVLELVRALKRDGSIFPGEKAISDDSARIRFGRKGNVGLYIAASWDVGVLTDQYPALIDWDVADMPVRDPVRRKKTVIISDYGYAISKRAAKKDLAKVAEVYRYLNGKHWQTRFYEEAKFHPANPVVYRKATPPRQKGWTGFSDPNNIVSLPFPDNVIRVKGPKWYQVFQMIYDGRLEIGDALERLNESYNEALSIAVKEGIVDLRDYVRSTANVRTVPK